MLEDKPRVMLRRKSGPPAAPAWPSANCRG